MRSRVNVVRKIIAAGFGLALSACAGLADSPLPAARSIVNGPAADYPVVIGDPFTIDGVTYTPSDTMNYDEIGYAAADGPGAPGVTAAHRTLPLPSYVEVTALDSGRTALVRVERRGPMTNARLIALSDAAMAQLGLGEGAPVRVRRVNPPEDHRSELRAQREAPLRMDTPAGLLEVLRRKLPASGAATLSDPRQAQMSGREPNAGTLAAFDPEAEATSLPPPEPAASAMAIGAPVEVESPSSAPAAAPGKFFVQLGAFGVRANADRLAAKVGGFVDAGDRLARVRTGPYATRGQAEQALAKLRAQGYSDARIETLR